MVVDLEKLTLARILCDKDIELLCSLSSALFTGSHLKIYNIIEEHYLHHNKIISENELRIKDKDGLALSWIELYKDFFVEPELLRLELESVRAREFFVDSVIDVADSVNEKTPEDLVSVLSDIQVGIADMDTHTDSLLEDAADTEISEDRDDLYSSGICSTFDNFFGGLGLQRLVAISGTRGSGKSIILQNMANHHYLEHKNTVLFANIEMSKVTVRERMLSMISGIPHSRIRTKALTDREKITVECAKAKFFYKNTPRLQEALVAFVDKGLEEGRAQLTNCEKKDERLLFLDDASLSIDKLAYYIRAIKKKHDLKMVCVDYLQILKDTNKEKGNPDWLAQTLIAVQLKELAKKENLIIATALQIHTDGGTKRALAIEDSLDLSLKFFPEINAATGEKTNLLKFYMAKTRESESRNFFADLDWNTLTLNYNVDPSLGFDDQERKDVQKA